MLALVMATTGTGIAQDAVSSAVKKIKGKQIAKNAITSKKVKDGSLLSQDFKAGELPSSIDAYTKAQVNALLSALQPKGDYQPVGDYQPKGDYQPAGDYLAANGKAADAETLDGKDSTEFLGKSEKAANADLLDGMDSDDIQHGDYRFNFLTMTEGAPDATLFTIPGLISVKGRCDTADPAQAVLVVEPLRTFDRFWFSSADNGSAPTVGTLAATQGNEQLFPESGQAVELQAQYVDTFSPPLGTLPDTKSMVALDAFVDDLSNTQCAFSANATVDSFVVRG